MSDRILLLYLRAAAARIYWFPTIEAWVTELQAKFEKGS